jgi:hypothetical protein
MIGVYYNLFLFFNKSYPLGFEFKNMISEPDVLSLNPTIHDLLKNKNKLWSTHIPHLHSKELHLRGVLNHKLIIHIFL